MHSRDCVFAGIQTLLWCIPNSISYGNCLSSHLLLRPPKTSQLCQKLRQFWWNGGSTFIIDPSRFRYKQNWRYDGNTTSLAKMALASTVVMVDNNSKTLAAPSVYLKIHIYRWQTAHNLNHIFLWRFQQIRTLLTYYGQPKVWLKFIFLQCVGVGEWPFIIKLFISRHRKSMLLYIKITDQLYRKASSPTSIKLC
jgi:hypothetical protein